uniref:Uncharacterized protein n=1 Tax=Phaeomonas parva TaxID=124430 RepID=A0A7S1Y1E4_9STRA
MPAAAAAAAPSADSMADSAPTVQAKMIDSLLDMSAEGSRFCWRITLDFAGKLFTKVSALRTSMSSASAEWSSLESNAKMCATVRLASSSGPPPVTLPRDFSVAAKSLQYV